MNLVAGDSDIASIRRCYQEPNALLNINLHDARLLLPFIQVFRRMARLVLGRTRGNAALYSEVAAGNVSVIVKKSRLPLFAA